MALTWSRSVGNTQSPREGEEEEMASMRARLQAMTSAAQAKDTALHDLQRRLQAAIDEAEQGRVREAALLRRAQRSEEAEEALASQMAELEAEAFSRITQANRLLAAGATSTSLSSIQLGGLERRLHAALTEAAWECKPLEEELEQGEAAFQSQEEQVEEVEAALVSQEREPEPTVAEGLKRQLTEAEAELQAVHAKLRQAEEKNRSLQMQLREEGGKPKRKEGEDMLLSVSLKDMAGFVKLKLWNPAYLTLTSPC